MGRGKSKAKQTKVARELKYGSGGSDLSALEAELKGESVEPDFAEEDLLQKISN
jgi:hypothetical protein